MLRLLRVTAHPVVDADGVAGLRHEVPAERGTARQRAETLAEEHGVPEHLTDAVRHSRVLVG